jgi:hypothetical protein
MRFTAAQRRAAWFLLTAPSASVGVKTTLRCHQDANLVAVALFV